jgi:hypothetical protein
MLWRHHNDIVTTRQFFFLVLAYTVILCIGQAFVESYWSAYLAQSAHYVGFDFDVPRLFPIFIYGRTSLARSPVIK